MNCLLGVLSLLFEKSNLSLRFNWFPSCLHEQSSQIQDWNHFTMGSACFLGSVLAV